MSDRSSQSKGVDRLVTVALVAAAVLGSFGTDAGAVCEDVVFPDGTQHRVCADVHVRRADVQNAATDGFGDLDIPVELGSGGARQWTVSTIDLQTWADLAVQNQLAEIQAGGPETPSAVQVIYQNGGLYQDASGDIVEGWAKDGPGTYDYGTLCVPQDLAGGYATGPINYYPTTALALSARDAAKNAEAHPECLYSATSGVPSGTDCSTGWLEHRYAQSTWLGYCANPKVVSHFLYPTTEPPIVSQPVAATSADKAEAIVNDVGGGAPGGDLAKFLWGGLDHFEKALFDPNEASQNYDAGTGTGEVASLNQQEKVLDGVDPTTKSDLAAAGGAGTGTTGSITGTADGSLRGVERAIGDMGDKIGTAIEGLGESLGGGAGGWNEEEAQAFEDAIDDGLGTKTEDDLGIEGEPYDSLDDDLSSWQALVGSMFPAVSVSGGACDYAGVISLGGSQVNVSFSLCEYADALAAAGNILFGIVGIMCMIWVFTGSGAQKGGSGS